MDQAKPSQCTDQWRPIDEQTLEVPPPLQQASENFPMLPDVFLGRRKEKGILLREDRQP